GGCHGKATGQTGFRLSLLGFEPDFDYEAIVHESRGRRLFPAAPELSLLLRKATAELPHGGGKRLQVNSEDYRILRQWIADGTPAPSVNDPTVTRIEISPGDQIMDSKA
ncbi:MAG: S-layer protein, partial [Phycisphaerae bacterium]